MVKKNGLVSTTDIAELFHCTKSNVSNMRMRYDDFPNPYADTSTGPVWGLHEIFEFYQRHKDKNLDVVITDTYNSIKIAIIGEDNHSGDKLFLASRFVYDKERFLDLFFSKLGEEVGCPVNLVVSESVNIETYVLRSNFINIFERVDNNEINEIKNRVSELVNHIYLQTDIDTMIKIRDLVRDINGIAKKYFCSDELRLYIDVFEKPSPFCRNILRSYKLNAIEIVTTCILDRTNFFQINKSDIYFFIVESCSRGDLETLYDLIDKTKSEISTRGVIFLSREYGINSTVQEYDEAVKKIQNEFKANSKKFDNFKNDIISTQMNVLDPLNNLIMYPVMNKDKASLQEELFLRDIGKKLNSMINNSSAINYMFLNYRWYKEIIEKHGREIVDFTISLLQGIPKHLLQGKGKPYSVEDFISEEHGRSMVEDNYRLQIDLDDSYQKEYELIYEYFSQLNKENYPNMADWQESVIKMFYEFFMIVISSDEGLGRSSYSLDELNTRTMWVEESILADRILKSIDGKDEGVTNKYYRKAMKDCNITSEFWDYVGSTDQSLVKKRLEIISKCLLDITVYNRKEMVLVRHVGGLRMLAEYNILQMLGYGDDDIIKLLKQFGFCEEGDIY